MSRPLLSLQEETLIKLEHMAHSAHGSQKVKFIDKDGKLKTGYFKKCDVNDYPTILGKYVVAFSVFIRAALGTRAAEERLVYNNEGKIVGTVAIQVPDFLPFLKPTDNDYEDPICQKWANPDKKTLIDKDVAALLVAVYKHIQDDLHPDNFSVNGVIDFDELYIQLTSILKGVRATSGVTSHSPQVVSELKEEDLKVFPNISVRTHWPTNMMPKNLNILKNYKTRAFLELQNDPEFRHQFLAALLKELLAYDEDMLEARLRFYLGEEKLDLHMLPRDKRIALELFGVQDKLFDGLEDTPDAFVQHVMRFYKAQHKKFEDMVLHYPEFQAFILAINKKPMEFARIKSWFQENNKINKVPYSANQIDEKYQYILRECIKGNFAKQLESLHNAIIANKISGEKEVSFTHKKECNHEIIDIMTSRLHTIQQKTTSPKVPQKANTFTQPRETKQLTHAILYHTHKHAIELYEEINNRKELYYKKDRINFEDNHQFVNDIEEILKNAEMKRIDYKKWLLETETILSQVEDFGIYIHPLVVEMDLIFNDLDQFTRSFKSEILTPLKSSEVPYLPQSIDVFTPKPTEVKKTPPLTPPNIQHRPHKLNGDKTELSKNIPQEISRLLVIWRKSIKQDQIDDCIDEARKEYNKKYAGPLGWGRYFFSPPRSVDENKLEVIFSTRAWNSTSFNTYLLKNLCFQMLDEYNKTHLLTNTDNLWWEKHAEEIAKQSGLKTDLNNPHLKNEIEPNLDVKILKA